MWELVGGAAVAVGASAVGWRIYQGYISQPHVRLEMDREKMRAYYREARSTLAAAQFPEPKEYAEGFMDEFRSENRDDHPVFPLTLELTDVAQHIYFLEAFQIPEPPPGTTTLEIARYNDQLASVIRRARNPRTMKVINDTLHEAFGTLKEHLPAIARQPLPLDVEGWFEGLTIEVPLVQLMDDVGEAITNTVMHFYGEEAVQIGLFAQVREQLNRNTHMASGVPFSPVKSNRRVFLPDDYPGDPEEIVQKFLANTPFQELFHVAVPFHIPQDARFEHQWICGGSGHGKSQTIQNLVLKDLEQVKEGKASVIVIDSQGDLINNIAGLQLFAPGQPLHGKLCLIDPTDIEYPVALNLFDVGMDRIKTYSRLDRERVINGVLELYDFVLGSLLAAGMTQKQSVIFRYITRLMLHIPNATILTLRDLMEPGGLEPYRRYVNELPPTARKFFESEFNSRQFDDTKRQVLRRLWGILENPQFERMFSHPRNKLDLFAEMNAGKVILINTAKELLKQEATEIFGRFFIAMIVQKAQERATIPTDKRMPTFVYVDEAADYLDDHTELQLREARKYKVGTILAHQYLAQLTPKLQEAFAANTSIKFAGGVSAQDAKRFAPMMHTAPEFIQAQPKLTFAAYVRGRTDTAVALSFPYGTLERQPRMTDEEREAVRTEMRERYAVHYSEIDRPEEGVEDVEFEDVPEGEPDQPDYPRLPPPPDPDTKEVEPADEW